MHAVIFHITQPSTRPHHAECVCGWRSIHTITARQAELIADAHIYTQEEET